MQNSGNIFPRPEESPAGRNLASIYAILEVSANGKPMPKQEQSGDGQLRQNILLSISRHRASMDYLLDKFKSGKLRLRTRRVFWWALVEMLWLDGLPVPVIVDTATAFIKRRHSPAEAAFCNALLRKIADLLLQGQINTLLADAPQAVQLELPDALYRRWKKMLSPEQLVELAAVLQQPAEVTLRRRATARQVVPTGLEELPALPWAPSCRLFRLHGSSLADILRQEDEYYVQDPSTLLAPMMLRVQPGEIVADLCCAPGGKALLLAESLAGQGRLLCRDRSAQRLSRVRENLRCWPNVEIAVGDALRPDLPAASLDALLLDVPCSNTGVIRRRPDVRWTFNEGKLRELVALQAQILDATASLLRPGGRLVYSTCSLELEENSRQAENFLQRQPEYSLLSERQLFPTSEHDGSYAALLQRK